MKRILTVFAVGASVLVAAVIANIIAAWIGVIAWYEFVEVIGEQGFLNAFGEAGLSSIVFLFLIYPLILGTAGYYSSSYFKKLIKA